LNLSANNKDLLELTAKQFAPHRPASFKVLALVGQSIRNRSTAQARIALVRFNRRTAPCSQKTGTQRMVAMDNLGSKRDYTILPPRLRWAATPWPDELYPSDEPIFRG